MIQRTLSGKAKNKRDVRPIPKLAINLVLKKETSICTKSTLQQLQGYPGRSCLKGTTKELKVTITGIWQGRRQELHWQQTSSRGYDDKDLSIDFYSVISRPTIPQYTILSYNKKNKTTCGNFFIVASSLQTLC